MEDNNIQDIKFKDLDWDNLSDHQKKWWTVQIKKHGSVQAAREFFRVSGAEGGRHSTPGGFGSDRELARRAGAKGGRISRPNTRK